MLADGGPKSHLTPSVQTLPSTSSPRVTIRILSTGMLAGGGLMT